MVSSVVPKALSKLKFLYRHGNCLNVYLRRSLCTALVQCQLDYCITAWFASLPKYLKHKLQVTENKMVRFVLDLPARSHIGQPQLDMLNYLNMHDRVSQLRLNHVFKISNCTRPVYLKEHFKKVNHVHSFSTRSNTCSNYFVPSINSVTRTAFYYNAVLDWKRLPYSIK